jgi:formylglycine-generating enzyme
VRTQGVTRLLLVFGVLFAAHACSDSETAGDDSGADGGGADGDEGGSSGSGGGGGSGAGTNGGSSPSGGGGVSTGGDSSGAGDGPGDSGGGGSGGSPDTGGTGGTGGGEMTPPSCVGASSTACRGESCCASALVPGGVFPQGDTDEFDATVFAYRLDKYEVTVGRMRLFVAAYDAWRAAGNPASGAGAHPLVAASGWSPSWNARLPALASDLTSVLRSGGPLSTWIEGSGNETLPSNSANYYLAFAFCAWDGARLPTESEWEYAASGGANDFMYPWGSTPVPDDADDSRAVYNALGDGSPGLAFADILPVGSRPLGRSVFEQYDLAGSMGEWVLDVYENYPDDAATNYANVAFSATATHVLRGGFFNAPAYHLMATHRHEATPTVADVNFGFRCARNP